jgi:hypothetical protein
MKCFIDGKEIAVGNDIKVIYERNYVTNENDTEVFADLHLTLTNEGLITDVVIGDDIVATNSELAEDMVGELVD